MRISTRGIRASCNSYKQSFTKLRTVSTKTPSVKARLYTTNQNRMELRHIVKKLQEFFPPRLAEKWDNTGLLVEPSTPVEIKKIFLTNDLTENVMQEAVQSSSNMILSYHPPIFSGLKRLTRNDPKERIILKAIENRIAIYSPHTSSDAAPGGVNDWLAKGVGDGRVDVIQPHNFVDPNEAVKIFVFVPRENLDKLREELSKVGAGIIGNYTSCSFTTEGKGSFMGNEQSNPTVGTKGNLEFVDEIKLEMVANRSRLKDIKETIKTFHPYETPGWEVHALEPTPVPGTGQGRLVTLKEKTKLPIVVERIKKHLGLNHLRLAVKSSSQSLDDVEIKTVALCAGAGAEVISKTRADLYLTGEMRHHDVLAAVENGTSVILCEHSNTERGYLTELKSKLENVFESRVVVEISKVDSDPLKVV